LSGTLKNSQHNNEDLVSMMSVDEMPIGTKRMNRNQRKRAGIMSSGNKIDEAKTIKNPRQQWTVQHLVKFVGQVCYHHGLACFLHQSKAIL
jgi:hypothetical protein